MLFAVYQKLANVERSLAKVDAALETGKRARRDVDSFRERANILFVTKHDAALHLEAIRERLESQEYLNVGLETMRNMWGHLLTRLVHTCHLADIPSLAALVK